MKWGSIYYMSQVGMLNAVLFCCLTPFCRARNVSLGHLSIKHKQKKNKKKIKKIKIKSIQVIFNRQDYALKKEVYDNN